MSSILSGRTRAAVMRHQRQLATQAQLLRTSDRLLCGTLVACDASTQRETLGDYFEVVQELRVSMQRLESLLDARLGRAAEDVEPALPTVER